MKRIAVCFDRLGPYHLARLASLAEHTTLLAVEFYAQSEEYAWDQVEAPSSFQRTTLFPQVGKITVAQLQTRIWESLDRFRPDIVAVPGWGTREALLTLKWGLDRRCPVILMSESQANDETRIGWKEFIKSRLVRLASAGLVGGSRHAEYLVELGMKSAQVFCGYDVVDNGHFARGAEQARSDREKLRRELSLPADFFLASARFVAKKNLSHLLKAYAAYRQMAGPTAWDLVLLGDGPLRPALETLRRELGLEQSVLLPGFRQYEQLPAYYGLARAFVHASSTEQWGLVVNEAMATGLPVLVSSRCGCASELVKEGENGFLFDPEQIQELSGRMLALTASPSPLPGMGEESRRIISLWSPSRFRDGFLRASEVCLSAVQPKPGWIDRPLLSALIRQ